MKMNLFGYILLAAPIFYQLDFRQRLEAEVSIPGLAGFAVKKSFETRYRPDQESVIFTKKTKADFSNEKSYQKFPSFLQD